MEQTTQFGDMRVERPKVLVVWSKCDSQSGARVTKLIKYLVYRGYDVTFMVHTMTSEISGADIVQIKPFPNPVGIMRRAGFHNLAKQLNKYLYVPDSSVLFSLKVFRYLRCSPQNYDVIITSSPFEGIHLVGLWCKIHMGIPWIADFRDQWMQDRSRYQPMTFFHDILCRKLEKKFYREPNLVIANTPPFAEMIKAKYGIGDNRLFVITNGYDPMDFEFATESLENSSQDKLSIGFNGIFEKGEKLPTEKVLNGIKWANENGANIILHLYGQQTPNTKEMVRKSGTEKGVVFHGPKPHLISLKSVVKHDALLVCLEDLGYTDKIVPLKLYEYLMIHRPIVGVLPENGYAAQIINESETGVVFSPNENLGKRFLDFYYQWKDGKSFRKSGDSKTTNFIKAFSWEYLILKWERVIERCLEF